MLSPCISANFPYTKRQILCPNRTMHQLSQAEALARQQQALLAAADDAATRQALTVILPVLATVATELQHTRYFLVANPQGEWRLTRLAPPDMPDLEKVVVLAYADRHQAELVCQQGPRGDRVTELAVLDLLFRLLAPLAFDSLVLMERDRSQEIQRQEVQDLCTRQIERWRTTYLA
ncbi:MAG: hypothetical protein HC918_04530 [Oscillatoriales cyanobacterium SM2_1_8]|nr:hypothetical protein [Oscillatoriales cyanobacterium SM2_1_8]